ncbi:hypothetical protein LCGC14_1761280 [marine sediment metagenome]|uniref:Uncharacterized protein n=1 Tax=marine sediment metagenome TaxID=412755 RepID=A0A0F9K0K5_9ZZZZ
MTKTEAIDRTIELWTWLAETGERHKGDWPGWKRHGGEYDLAGSDCFLCKHSLRGQFTPHCTTYCLYCLKFGHCVNGYFDQWNEAGTPRTRKKYAKLFLEQVKSLKED